MSWYTLLLPCLNPAAPLQLINNKKPATVLFVDSMSGFKRHQSKVFWSQMETLDSYRRVDAAVVPKLPPRAVVPVAPPRPKPLQLAKDEEDAFSLSGDGKLDGGQDSDTDNDGLNVTVIHVELGERSEKCEAPVASLSASSGHPRAERSFSPLTSRSQRSQDSGFSDSGRSDDSSAGATRSSPRRSKRRSSRRKRSSGSAQLAVVESQQQGEQAAIVHTSTPKRGELQRWSTCGRLVMQQEEDVGPETLDDFLFAGDPPLDEAASDCVAATPSQRTYPPAIILGKKLHAPVGSWLAELRHDIDEECQATLQSKSLPRRKLLLANGASDATYDEKNDSGIQRSALTAAKKIIDVADRFERKYQRLVDTISQPMDAKSQRELLHTLEAEATELLLKFGVQPPRRINCRDNLRGVSAQLGRLKSCVDRATDQRLDFYIDKIVCSLDEATREDGITARGAVAALTALGLTGTRAGSSISRCSGIRALLTALVSANVKTLEPRSSILKALACCCCCLDAIDQFVKESGPELISDVLNDEDTPVSVKSDVTTLLVQITSPWMDRSGLMYMEPYANDVMKALTRLAVVAESSQTLLLVSAAVNNLAYSGRCVGAIIRNDSIKKLLRCVKKAHNDNYGNALMEQVAELISKVSRVPQARSHLAETRASIALVCFLRLQPPGLENHRLVEKASEALTRLCVDPEIAKQVVAFTGSDCLTIIHGNNAKVQRDVAAADSCDPNDDGFFKSTKSLRVARRIAAEQIDIARGGDDYYSPR